MRAVAVLAAAALAGAVTASGAAAATPIWRPALAAPTVSTPSATTPAGASRSRSRTAPRDRAGSADPATAPPVPPPAAVAPPPGRRPGPTPGLRRPASCTPSAADEPPPVDAGALRLQLAAVHRLATGSGQVIAVIDTGVHPDARFGGRLRGGGDYVAGGDGLDDCDGHGTAVAGLIGAAAAGRDAGGLAGIAPAAQLVSIRQSSPSIQAPTPAGALRPVGDVATLADAN